MYNIRKGENVFGVFLIVVGCLWLLSNLGVITANMSDIIWPVVIILCGLWVFFRPKKWYSQVWKKVQIDTDTKEEDHH